MQGLGSRLRGVSYSAQGTRLNRRGVESRRRIIELAIEMLADETSEPITVNLIARRAGYTWGVVQHQFGDADGVWAAVAESVLKQFRAAPVSGRAPRQGTPLRRRVAAMVDELWRANEAKEARAMDELRRLLPSDPQAFAASFPKTEAVMRRWDVEWRLAYELRFTDLGISRAKIDNVRRVAPAAVSGLVADLRRSRFPDADGRRSLIEILVAYLR